jgi:hypothetical protein
MFKRVQSIRHFCHVHAPSKRVYRTALMLGGAALYLVHCTYPEHEISVVLLLHGMVTFDPTV